MKRVYPLIVIILLLISSILACSSDSVNNPVTVDTTAVNREKGEDIVVQSPMTLSNNDMYPISGEHQYLRLRMVKGKYYEDWNPGAYMGTLWEGYYIIELANEFGEIIAQTALSEFYKEQLTFKSSFNIEFDDYNNDGDVDFTIGQYASSNGMDYKLFTLRKNGRVEELHVKDYPTLFITSSAKSYSSRLTKVDKVTFQKEYYDNSKGRHFEDVFKWEGNEFIHIMK